MLLYFCFVVTLNLAIGYALGVYLGPPPIGGFSWRKGEDFDSQPLVQPTADAAPAESTTAEQVERAVDPKQNPSLRDGMPEVSETEVLSGLDAFQQQLAELGEQLESSVDDEGAFGEQANRLQEANHAYLETAQDQIENLDPMGEAHKTATAGVEQVDKVSKEFDAIMDEGLADEGARKQLVEKSTELTEKVGEAREELNDQVKAIKQQRDAATGLATIDGLIAQIEGVIGDSGNEQLRTAALIKTDPPEAEQDPELTQRMKDKLVELVSQRLSEMGQAAKLEEGELLLLLERAEINSITEQIDTLRQEIAQTIFVHEDQEISATVTCAVVDLPGAKNRDAVLQRLEDAMAESGNHGLNHTFYHDGSFASVIEPATKSIESSRVEI